MFSIQFWKEVGERAVKTFAQAVLAMLTGDQVDLIESDPGKAVKVALLAALVSVLTSIASGAVGPAGSASLVTPAGLSRLAANTRGLLTAVSDARPVVADSPQSDVMQERADVAAATLDDLGLGRRR